jgi:hypothetical protein
MTRWLPAALWLGLAAAGFAQTSTPPATTPAPSSPAPAAPAPNAPEEYKEEEFGPGLKALRRGEIILFGSVPLTLFLSYEAYDIFRYFAHERIATYAPWPFRSANAVAYQDWETTAVLVTAVSLSLTMALTDYLIGKALERRAAKHRSPDR